MKIELQRLVDGIWYIYGNYDMSKPHDATAFGEAVSELAKHFNIRTVVSYTDVEKQVEELEDKIADIKANCDLAIEGRDIKIDELEEKNSYMFDTIALQEQQIEKMKCCENCKHKKSEVDRCELLMYTMNACLCKNKDKWELKE